jgi:hypothetical protein
MREIEHERCLRRVYLLMDVLADVECIETDRI